METKNATTEKKTVKKENITKNLWRFRVRNWRILALSIVMTLSIITLIILFFNAWNIQKSLEDLIKNDTDYVKNSIKHDQLLKENRKKIFEIESKKIALKREEEKIKREEEEIKKETQREKEFIENEFQLEFKNNLSGFKKHIYNISYFLIYIWGFFTLIFLCIISIRTIVKQKRKKLREKKEMEESIQGLEDKAKE